MPQRYEPVEKWERRPGAATAPLGGYRRRVPEQTLLHQVVRERLELYYEGWTVEADGHALLPGTLAATGPFVLRGRTGLGGRGKWLVMLGLLPALASLLLRRW